MAKSAASAEQFVTVTPNLKAWLRARAEAEGTNLNDVAVAILAEAFDVPFEPTGRHSPDIGDSLDIVLKMPIRLKRKIKAQAGIRDKTIRGLILSALQAERDRVTIAA